jgi:hypothetical protein
MMSFVAPRGEVEAEEVAARGSVRRRGRSKQRKWTLEVGVSRAAGEAAAAAPASVLAPATGGGALAPAARKTAGQATAST